MTGVRPSPVFLAVVAVAAAGGALAWVSDINSIWAGVGVFVLVVAGWIVTLCLHEFAHAYLAWKAGDTEVEIRGYLTLNPVKYSHPVLSIVLPILFIAVGGIGLPGGAVYVQADQFKPTAARFISLAGPLMNALAGVVLLWSIFLLGIDSPHVAFWTGIAFLGFLQITALLLNLLPIPGLDGYGVLEPSLSPQTRAKIEPYRALGLLFVMALLFVPQLNSIFFSVVFWIYGLTGADPLWAQIGGQLTRFWIR
ncbi:MAG: site-2 protease family protein [Nocardiaceae bacterium]|nr:site-2 protease family protein [Nocardiaceae bacterium]